MTDEDGGNEPEAERFDLLDRRFEEFRRGDLGLGELVGELERVVPELEDSPTGWRKQAIAQTRPLARERSLAAEHGGPMPGASDSLVAHAMTDLEKTLDQWRANRARNRTAATVVVRQDNGDYDLQVLAGAQVEWVNLNVRAELRFMRMHGDAREYVAKLAISEPFHIFDGTERHPAYFGPPNDGPPYGLDVLARLIQATATGGTAFASGALEVEFSNGWRIDVPYGEMYEAWELWWTSGEMFSLPGGGLG